MYEYITNLAPAYLCNLFVPRTPNYDFRNAKKKLFLLLSHAGQNYWMLIGWDSGHFSLIKRALLVIKRAWLLDADWLSTPALNWFPASNGVWKKNFRNASLLSLILTRSFHLDVKEYQHATNRSHLVEKRKDFSDQKRIDSQRENGLSVECIFKVYQIALVVSRLGQFCENFANTREINP